MSIAKCDIGRIEIYDRQSRVAGDLEARQKHRRIGLSAGSRAGNGCGEKEGGVVRVSWPLVVCVWGGGGRGRNGETWGNNDKLTVIDSDRQTCTDQHRQGTIRKR